MLISATHTPQQLIDEWWDRRRELLTVFDEGDRLIDPSPATPADVAMLIGTNGFLRVPNAAKALGVSRALLYRYLASGTANRPVPMRRWVQLLAAAGLITREWVRGEPHELTREYMGEALAAVRQNLAQAPEEPPATVPSQPRRQYPPRVGHPLRALLAGRTLRDAPLRASEVLADGAVLHGFTAEGIRLRARLYGDVQVDADYEAAGVVLADLQIGTLALVRVSLPASVWDDTQITTLTLNSGGFPDATWRRVTVHSLEASGDCDLARVRWSDCSVAGSVAGCDLRGAVLIGCDLRDLNLAGCDLRGAVLIGCDLPTEAAMLAGVRLDGAYLRETTAPGLLRHGLGPVEADDEDYLAELAGGVDDVLRRAR